MVRGGQRTQWGNIQWSRRPRGGPSAASGQPRGSTRSPVAAHPLAGAGGCLWPRRPPRPHSRAHAPPGHTPHPQGSIAPGPASTRRVGRGPCGVAAAAAWLQPASPSGPHATGGRDLGPGRAAPTPAARMDARLEGGRTHVEDGAAVEVCRKLGAVQRGAGHYQPQRGVPAPGGGGGRSGLVWGSERLSRTGGQWWRGRGAALGRPERSEARPFLSRVRAACSALSTLPSPYSSPPYLKHVHQS